MAGLLRELEKEELRDDLPDFGSGDTVKILYLVREGEKERIQAFEGVCLGRRGGGDERVVHGPEGVGSCRG